MLFHKQYIYIHQQEVAWFQITTISGIKSAKAVKRKINNANERLAEERTLLLQNPYIINGKQCFLPL